MSVAWVQRYIEMRTPSIILRDTFNWNDTPFSIEFHWHMELFFEAVMKSLSCYQEHMSRCAPAVTEMFELVKSMFNNNFIHNRCKLHACGYNCGYCQVSQYIASFTKMTVLVFDDIKVDFAVSANVTGWWCWPSTSSSVSEPRPCIWVWEKINNRRALYWNSLSLVTLECVAALLLLEGELISF